MTQSSSSAQPAATFNSQEPLDEFALGLIRRTVARLTRQRGFSRADRDDLRQELTLFVLEKAPAYDPSRGHYYAYLTAIVKRHAGRMRRRLRAESRTYLSRGVSLHHLVDSNGEKLELGQTLGADIHCRRTAKQYRSDIETSELHSDIEAILATLPPSLAALARRLQSESTLEIAQSQGISRSSVVRKLNRLRKLLAENNIGEYAGKFLDNF